jgi:chorismate synthase
MKQADTASILGGVMAGLTTELTLWLIENKDLSSMTHDPQSLSTPGHTDLTGA